MSTLLVVDDEQSICWGLKKLGESMGLNVVTASSAEKAFDIAAENHPDVVVLDVRLPGMDGLSAISHLREILGSVPIIMITAYGDLETAVETVRQGAFEYIIKPFDLEKVERAISRALASAGKKLSPANRQASGNLASGSLASVGGLVGSSAVMQEVFKQIALAATSHASVLLHSESGTGKELASRAIHKYSDRANGPFVAVNVASLSSSLAESELFGHVRGAFTGADQDRVGLLAQAHGGTLFLDEVADIPLPTQVKLLRVLEYGEVTPVGSNKPVRSDFRVVSATHQDLLKKVNSGDFRHDLYFRLAAFRIDIPPLRRRREDILELAEHFLSLSKTRGASEVSISPAAIAEMQSRPWYGNVRELRHAIEHAMIVARGGTIEPEHLPSPSEGDASTEESISLDAAVAKLISRWSAARLDQTPEAEEIYEQLLQLVEPPLMEAAIKKYNGQCAAAARQLGIHRTTLRKKLDQYNISSD